MSKTAFISNNRVLSAVRQRRPSPRERERERERERHASLKDENQEKISARVQHSLHLQAQLPFDLTRWSAVTAAPCPHYPGSQSTERGLVWAHYRIWRDFAAFDEDLLARAAAAATTESALSSSDGVYAVYGNGTRVKHGQVVRDEDVLAVFEDDATSAVADTRAALAAELRALHEDVLFLGWCEGRMARPVPLCAHAYAITRRAARKLVHYLEPCGRAVDEQFVILAKNGWLSYRRAHPASYSTHMLRADFNPYGDKTVGIFRQCKSECGSTNGNRR